MLSLGACLSEQHVQLSLFDLSIHAASSVYSASSVYQMYPMQVGDVLISSNWKNWGYRSVLKETSGERKAYHSVQVATALGGTRH